MVDQKITKQIADEMLRVSVTVNAVNIRVRASLAKEGKVIMKMAPGSSKYFILDVRRDKVVATDVVLEIIARELGCLRTWETMDKPPVLRPRTRRSHP